MNDTVIALINTGIKLAAEFIILAEQLEKEGIKVPDLDDVKARLEKLKNSPPLPTKPTE